MAPTAKGCRWINGSGIFPRMGGSHGRGGTVLVDPVRRSEDGLVTPVEYCANIRRSTRKVVQGVAIVMLSTIAVLGALGAVAATENVPLSLAASMSLEEIFSGLSMADFMAKDFASRAVHMPATEASSAIFRNVVDLDDIARPSHTAESRVERLTSGEHLELPEQWDPTFLKTLLAEGDSFVLHYPAASSTAVEPTASIEPVLRLAEQVRRAFSLPEVSANVYVSGPGSSALKPHTDRYDTFVLQLEGSKQWQLCVPVIHSDEFDAAELSDATAAEMSETARDNVDGCSSFAVEDLNDENKMRCTDVITEAGDVLYIPKAVVHWAHEASSDVSVHLTLGLHRGELTWASVFEMLVGNFDYESYDGAWVSFGYPDLHFEDAVMESLENIEATFSGVAWRGLFPVWIEQPSECWDQDTYCLPSRASFEFRSLVDIHEEMVDTLTAGIQEALLAKLPATRWTYATVDRIGTVVSDLINDLTSDDAVAQMLTLLKSRLEQLEHDVNSDVERRLQGGDSCLSCRATYEVCNMWCTPDDDCDEGCRNFSCDRTRRGRKCRIRATCNRSCDFRLCNEGCDECRVCETFLRNCIRDCN